MRVWLFLSAIVALIGSTGADAALTISKSVSTAWDPTDLGVLPKAIPGAQVDYTITVSNAVGQSTAKTVVITDQIPSKMKFYVGTGNPVTVTIGALSSLTYTYSSLSSSTDGLDFSKDGGTTWTYTPVAGADGSDPLVTNIRVTTGGSQLAGDSFTIKFRTVVK